MNTWTEGHSLHGRASSLLQVAQVSNLLYRRFPIGGPRGQPNACASQAGSTAKQQIGNLRYAFQSLAAVILISAMLLGTAAANPLYRVTNVSPNPSLTNEFYLTATNTVTSIDGTNVHVFVYKDDPPAGGGVPMQLPGPLIEVNVGQTVICHFKNKLTNNIEGASIHWHGIELDNDSDGTAVAQDTIFNGQTYTYRFIAPRAGLFWYHSHMLPGTTTFGGMYGPLIVHDTNETALIAANVLPPANRTFQLVMTDVSFTNGVIGKVLNGTNFSLNTLIQLCENNILGLPNANGAACGVAGPPGDILLCNGSVASRAGTFCAPTTGSSPLFHIGIHQRVRLQLFNESISRNCYLTLRYPCSNPGGDTNLYHIGGQGGLLDNAVLDGGVQSGYDFQYASGTVNLGSGMREDVLFYSSGNSGDVIQLVGNPLAGSWKLSGTLPTNYPVAFFVLTNGGATNTPLISGSPLLSAIGASNENLRLLNTNTLASPPIPADGTQDGLISLMNNTPANGVNTGPNIGGYAATALDGNSGNGSWPDVPHPPTALWARAGDVVQLAIANNTGTDGGGSSAVHPYHLHGFSMQPVAFYTSDLQTNLFNFPYNQFVDTFDILPGQALVFRIKLSDRPVLADTATGGPLTLGTDAATGGNLGRWLMHCHIFLHGTIGMISELNVVPNTATRLVGPSAGTNSVILAGNSGVAWSNTASVPWLHFPAGNATGNGTKIVLFTYDANPGSTRTGTLNVAGETVAVTQAGANYVQAPGPVTTLATGLSGPTGMAADRAGNVYFCDGGHGALKMWNPSGNTVTTLASGFGTLQGLALDGLGNVYFADFNSSAIRMWSASTHSVSTAFNTTSTGVSGLAVDNSGNVYLTIPSQNLVQVWNASSGTLNGYTTNGLNSPYGVAVDVAGDVFVADTSNNAIKKFGYTFIPPFTFIPTWFTTVSSNYLNHPWNLAVDDGANIYIADGFHNAIKRFNFASNTVDTLISSGLSDPTDVAVDGTGNVYLSDFNNNAVKELPYAFVDPTPQHEGAEATADSLSTILLPTENLLPPFAPTASAFWINYNGSANGIVNFSVNVNLGGPRSGTLTVLGQPITINQDGASSGVGTTNLLVGPAAGSNTVSEFVIPSISLWSASTTTPWLHLPFTSGTGSGNVLFTYDANLGSTRVGTLTVNTKTVTVTQAGSTYVQAPGPLTTLVGSGLVQPVDVAVDAAGNVIFSDSGNNTVKKWSRATSTVSTIISSGLSTPQGIDVDPFGNIFVVDLGSESIKEWRAADSNFFTLVSAPQHPSGLTLGYGTNIYWSDPGNNSINEWIASSSNVVSLVFTNLDGSYGLDVDVGGNIYIADTVNNAVKKYNPATATLSTLATSGINTPWNVAVDGSGNVYVANGSANNILKWVAASSNLVTVVPAGVSDPTGVKVDASQNIYIADFGHAAVKELPYAFVDPSTRSEPWYAGSDSLPVVIPSNQNLSGPFAPTDPDPWLQITGVTNGVVSFNFSPNTNSFGRTTFITLLGQGIPVVQAAAVQPVVVSASTPSNGVFYLSFTNTTAGAAYSVVSTTNILTPMPGWNLVGPAMQIAPDLWQFVDHSASNKARFYRIRSP
ncbi:MAG: hypothetical protein C5B50_29415 [Verrucomicrobia bacterium]|nr:MAG: hypothetical protein C5B50_29415 [Verrucomicrobiota bacterium]